jgi:hypothetical protein
MRTSARHTPPPPTNQGFIFEIPPAVGVTEGVMVVVVVTRGVVVIVPVGVGVSTATGVDEISS